MGHINEYFSSLIRATGTGWNRFWFSRRDPSVLCVMRVLIGLLALYFVVSHSADLVTWFGPHGILSVETTNQLTGADQGIVFRYSYLYFAKSPTELWIAHGIGIAVVGLFALGLWSRITSVLALIVVLSYVHRGPMLIGPFEPVLTMIMAYLCIAPCGARYSLDAWMKRRKAGADDAEPPQPSLSANLSQRLIQVHVAGFYLMIGLNQLGAETWWNGEAVWWLIARSETRLWDLTSLHNQTILINFWTHGIVAFELLFGILIWNRLARPLLLGISLLLWLPLIPITGLTSFCLTMIVAGLCYVEPSRA